MGQRASRSFTDDGILQSYYQNFNRHKDRIKVTLESNSYDPYAMKSILRTAKLIASHPDDVNGNPNVSSTAELVEFCLNVGKDFAIATAPSQEKLFEGQQLIYDSYAEIIMARHRKDPLT